MIKKLFGMFSILFGFNLIVFFISLLFYEYSDTVNLIVEYSFIPLFLVLSFLLAKYIFAKFDSPLFPMSILLLCLGLLRLGSFLFESNILGTVFQSLGWVSFLFIQVILNNILSVGDNYLYLWTVFLFPIIQVLFCIMFYYIEKLRSNRKKYSSEF